jgi:hypothetical protein
MIIKILKTIGTLKMNLVYIAKLLDSKLTSNLADSLNKR